MTNYVASPNCSASTISDGKTIHATCRKYYGNNPVDFNKSTSAAINRVVYPNTDEGQRECWQQIVDAGYSMPHRMLRETKLYYFGSLRRSWRKHGIKTIPQKWLEHIAKNDFFLSKNNKALGGLPITIKANREELRTGRLCSYRAWLKSSLELAAIGISTHKKF